MRAYGSSSLSFECVKVADDADEECLQKVKNQEADVTVVGGNELFAANNQYSLAAIVAESTGTELGDASYYGVALTKRENCQTVDNDNVGGPITGLDGSLKVKGHSYHALASLPARDQQLIYMRTEVFLWPEVLAPFIALHCYPWVQSKKACHTGYRKTSGWYLPVAAVACVPALPLCSGKLSKEGSIDFDQWAEEAREEGVRVDAEAVEKFWDDNVCAPGNALALCKCDTVGRIWGGNVSAPSRGLACAHAGGACRALRQSNAICVQASDLASRSESPSPSAFQDNCQRSKDWKRWTGPDL
eukprot:scaffold57579_cov19-Tisochrysis_lutea.AAC.1